MKYADTVLCWAIRFGRESLAAGWYIALLRVPVILALIPVAILVDFVRVTYAPFEENK